MKAIKHANETLRNPMKNTLEEVNSSLDTEQESISEVEVRAIEIMPNAVTQKEKKTKNKWTGFGELWNNKKQSSISVTWVPEGNKKKEKTGKWFEEVMP